MSQLKWSAIAVVPKLNSIVLAAAFLWLSIFATAQTSIAQKIIIIDGDFDDNTSIPAPFNVNSTPSLDTFDNVSQILLDALESPTLPILLFNQVSYLDKYTAYSSTLSSNCQLKSTGGDSNVKIEAETLWLVAHFFCSALTARETFNSGQIAIHQGLMEGRLVRINSRRYVC
jgi:hypothetical protein